MGARGLLLAIAFLAFINSGGCGSRSSVLDGLVTSALSAFQKHMATGWPDIGIPPLDTFELPLTHLPKKFKKYSQLSALTESKMSDFTTELVESDVLSLRAGMGLSLPVLEFTGSQFTLGDYRAELRDVMIGVGVTFFMLEEERTLEVDDLKVIFDSSSGNVDSVEKARLLELLELTYQPFLEEALRYEINIVLQGEGEDDDIYEDDPIDDFFDRLLADIRQIILDDHLDPMHLPEDSDDFSVEIFNNTVDGTVTVNKGSLKGLSTIHRAGNMSMRVVVLPAEVIWDGEVGFNDLELDYTFSLDFPIFGKDLSLSLKLSYVHLSFETDVYVVRENITLARCNITELGPVHFKEKGAGPLDSSLYDLLVNAFLGGLHNFVQKMGGEVVCNLLETVLSQV